jgi:hypothetical protein
MFYGSFRISLFPVIPVFAALALLISADAILAQAKPKAPTKLSNEELVASIHRLGNIKHTLEKADHDYGGHRGAAVHEVKTAEHQLYLALEHANAKNVPKTKKDFDSAHPPQILSNKELAASIPVLKNTHKLLQQGDFDYGGHRAKAVTELGTAITQLEKALVFIKGKKPK